MQNIKNKISLACLMALPLLLSNCKDSDDKYWSGAVQEQSNLTLVLNVNGDSNSLTRAEGDPSDNPMGGENGNGLRQGEHHENDIDNLCFFVFADNEAKGVKGLADDVTVKDCRFIDGVDFKPSYANSFYGDVISTEVKVKFNGKLVYGKDAFLVVANAGDIVTELKNRYAGDSSKVTLKEVRDFLITKTLTRPTAADAKVADCTRFTMANANNSRNIGGAGTEANPYRVVVDLERTTARVDFWYQPSLDAANHPASLPTAPLLGYKVIDKYNESVQTGWLYISHIKLMNVAQYASYALKRLATASGEVPAYLADEEHVNDEADKYVVEPYTWEKSGDVDYTVLYGNTHIQAAADKYAEDGFFTAREAVRNYATPQTYPNDNDGFNAGWSKDRISGEAYYVLDYINENTVEKEHTSGLNTTSLLLKTTFVPVSIIYAVNEKVWNVNPGKYGDTFLAMEVIQNNNERRKYYFKDLDAVKVFRSANPTWTTSAPVEYKNGVCYYTIWIRHDNNGNDALIGKMEYGIVRNNIYRIGVNKVLGPGSPTPVATENPEDVNLHIYVRKWNLMEVPTIKI